MEEAVDIDVDEVDELEPPEGGGAVGAAGGDVVDVDSDVSIGFELESADAGDLGVNRMEGMRSIIFARRPGGVGREPFEAGSLEAWPFSARAFGFSPVEAGVDDVDEAVVINVDEGALEGDDAARAAGESSVVETSSSTGSSPLAATASWESDKRSVGCCTSRAAAMAASPRDPALPREASNWATTW